MNNAAEFNVGAMLHRRLVDLFPICRSITGEGVRQTLDYLGRLIPLQKFEVPSGTAVFDWTVPKEWHIRDAWVKDSSGQKIIDFQQNNLHVVNYSAPIRAKMSLSELRPHLHSLPSQPQSIPYKTSYYKNDWGFCLADNMLTSLSDGEYEVCIDATHFDGNLTYGECYLPGENDAEVLISTHICHPSLANDNLSGVVIAAEMVAKLARMHSRRYNYRFLFIPGTIGAITWLATNPEKVSAISHGLVLSGLGGPGGMTYKKSRIGDAGIDRIATRVLRENSGENQILDFSPYGYDERQFCSPGINLPMGCLSRSPFGTYPEYHTSEDNIDFVTPESLAGSLQVVGEILQQLETEVKYESLSPRCEPQLGRRGLYDVVGDRSETMALLWLLNLSDGKHSLRDIADRSAFAEERLAGLADQLVSRGLLKKLS